jgi:LmbE family N-acetylglucosaminyl deacetylase
MNILFTGAHPDDIEHSSGALFCRLLKEKEHKVKYLAFSKCTDLQRNAGIANEIEEVKKYIRSNKGEITILDLPNRRLPEYSWEIREHLWEEKENFDPDVIFTHWENDIHQDHKVIANECLRTFRNKNIISYECVRSCPSFTSNFYIAMEEEDIKSKLKLLYLYKTQKNLYYNQEDVLWSLARLRGAEIGEGFAEGYYATRVISDGKLRCV